VKAIDTVAQLGVCAILSSGGAQTALEGAPTLARMVAAGDGKLEVMAGGGITEANAGRVVHATGVRAIHVRCSALQLPLAGAGSVEEPRVRLRKPLPADERAWEDSSEARIRQVVIAASGGMA
jgi:copper homeostasis protein